MRVPQRGRAILRRLVARDSERGFRPGDFLLTTSDGGLAKLQGWATGCELNHAAIIIDPLGSAVEANPSVRGDAHAFRLTSVNEYLAAGKPCWIGYVELREGTRQDVADYALHLLRGQKAGSASGRVWLTLHTLFGIAPRALSGRVSWLNGLYRLLNDHAVVLREEHCYLSAELVARALERGGFIWECDPAFVTPADLLTSFHQLDALLAPLQLAARRQSNLDGATSEGARHDGALSVFHPRSARDTSLISNAPREAETPQAGMQALARVGVLMAASLAVIGLLEETIRFVARDA